MVAGRQAVVKSEKGYWTTSGRRILQHNSTVGCAYDHHQNEEVNLKLTIVTQSGSGHTSKLNRILFVAIGILILCSIALPAHPAAAEGDIVGQIADDIVKVSAAIDAIKHQVRSTRSAVLEVDNKYSGLRLAVKSTSHAHGRFEHVPRPFVSPDEVALFSSRDKSWSFGAGTAGSLVYTAAGIEFSVAWSVPFVGGNSCDATVTGPQGFRYWAYHSCAGGNNGVEMLYALIDCEQLPDAASRPYPGCTPFYDFRDALQELQSAGATPVNDWHAWRDGVVIQDWQGGSCGECALIWGGNAAVGPQVVGSGMWAAFKESVNVDELWPGYPINAEHWWNGLRIQDVRGGTHGDGAFIGGEHAKLVTWRTWPAYIKADGSRRLRNPVTSLSPRQDSAGNWFDVQTFEGGVIWARKQETLVCFYDTRKCDRM